MIRTRSVYQNTRLFIVYTKCACVLTASVFIHETSVTSLHVNLGIDVNQTWWRLHNGSLFELAASNGCTGSLAIMIPHADLNISYGFPLRISAAKGHLTVTKVLLAAGADHDLAIRHSLHATSEKLLKIMSMK